MNHIRDSIRESWLQFKVESLQTKSFVLYFVVFVHNLNRTWAIFHSLAVLRQHHVGISCKKNKIQVVRMYLETWYLPLFKICEFCKHFIFHISYYK